MQLFPYSYAKYFIFKNNKNLRVHLSETVSRLDKNLKRHVDHVLNILHSAWRLLSFLSNYEQRKALDSICKMVDFVTFFPVRFAPQKKQPLLSKSFNTTENVRSTNIFTLLPYAYDRTNFRNCSKKKNGSSIKHCFVLFSII